MIPEPAPGDIELTVPGNGRHIRLARLVGGGVAATQGLGMEVVEDTRIAVDEICSALIELGEGRPLRLIFAVDGDTLMIHGATDLSVRPSPDPDRVVISQRILEVLTNWHELTHTDGQARLTVAIPVDRHSG